MRQQGQTLPLLRLWTGRKPAASSAGRLRPSWLHSPSSGPATYSFCCRPVCSANPPALPTTHRTRPQAPHPSASMSPCCAGATVSASLRRPLHSDASPPSPARPPPPCQAPLWPSVSASPSPGIRPFGHISRLCAPCTRLKAGLSWASWHSLSECIQWGVPKPSCASLFLGPEEKGTASTQGHRLACPVGRTGPGSGFIYPTCPRRLDFFSWQRRGFGPSLPEERGFVRSSDPLSGVRA